MGGKSKSSLQIENGVAKFTGTCAIVPFLKAPGFITMVTGGFFSWKKEVFPDVSSCSGLSFSLKTNVDYAGYRVSFGKQRVSGGGHASGYKAALVDVPSGDFGDLVIPFKEFSSKWDEATGDIQVSCAEDSQYCPSQEWLADMQTISFWGEGIEGKVDLDIQSISAVGCTEEAATAALTMSLSRGSAAGGYVLLLCCVVLLMNLAQRLISKRQDHAQYDEITQGPPEIEPREGA